MPFNLTEFELYQQSLVTFPIQTVKKMQPVGAYLFPTGGRTDRHDEVNVF
jgi:hypothetical protein